MELALCGFIGGMVVDCRNAIIICIIGQIHVAKDNENANNILMINSLDDLKDRLGKVILMILIVAFFKNVLHVTFDDPLNILYMGGGIFLISLALYFGHKAGGDH